VLEVFARRAYDPTVVLAGERVPLIDPETARTRTGAPA
jgi:predicted HD phosphohydrolase